MHKYYFRTALICLLILLFFPLTTIAKESSLYEMSPSEIDDLLTALKGKNFETKITVISELAKGTPYFLGPLGEGSDSPYDKHPLMDLKRVDCVTFCEQTYALTLADSYNEAFQILQKIRYKNGDKRIQTRNHYFMVDWVPNNQWLFKDVTVEIGGQYIQKVTRTISHQKFFAGSKYTDIKAEEADRTLTLAYVPKASLHLIEGKLQTGDIAVFIQDLKGIFASHTGLIIREGNRVFFRNATSRKEKKVMDETWPALIEYLKSSKRNLGLAFIRPKNYTQSPGRE